MTVETKHPRSLPRVAVTRIIMYHRSLSTGIPRSAGLQKPGILAQWARTTRILMSSSAYNYGVPRYQIAPFGSTAATGQEIAPFAQ